MRHSACLALLALLPLRDIRAAEYFVDARASGQAVQEGSAAQPWGDIVTGVSRLSPGDTLSIRPGLYRQREIKIEADDVRVRKDPAVPGVVAIDGDVPLHELKNQDADGRQKTWDNGPFFHPAIVVTGNGVALEGLEVRHAFMGISMRGERSTVRACHVHHVGQHGIEVMNHQGLVEDCIVHDANLYNVNGQCLVGGQDPATGAPNQNIRKKIASPDPARNGKNMDWGQGITFHGKYREAWAPRGCILRRNVVWSIWGEGVATYNASDVRIEDNVAINIWRVAYYVQNADSVTLDGNLAFYERDFRARLGDGAMALCYSFANEYPADLLRVASGSDQPLVPDCSDVALTNNISWRGDYALHSGDRHPVGTRGPIRIENNILLHPAVAPCINLNASVVGPVEIHHNFLGREGGGTEESGRFIALADGIKATVSNNRFYAPDPGTDPFATAMDESLKGLFTQARQAWPDRLEALRTEINSVRQRFHGLSQNP